jgi:two-component system, LytTR family, response regulator
MRVVIVDDTKLNRDLLKMLLERYTPHVEVVEEANSVASGLEIIASVKPELVLLDIELGDGTAFDLLDAADPTNFSVIFVTAYNKYAEDALKISGMEYLLKPVIKDELVGAIQKVEDLNGESNIDESQLREIRAALDPEA